MSISSKDLTPEMLARIGEKKPAPETAKASPAQDRMNKWEREYAKTLRMRMAAGEIRCFLFEPCKFRLGHDWNTTYTPDFGVVMADGLIEMHEVKGFRRDDAMKALKVAAGMYPLIFRLVTKRKGESGWQVETVRGAAQQPTGD